MFSTKDRSPTIAEDIRPIMHEYLGGTVAALGSQSLGVGGTADHVHLLIELDRKACVADLTGKVKAASSKWMKQYQRGFTWQGGYGAFSFARTELRHLRSYVAQQEEHHRAVTFEDELRSLLHAHEMTWDERYLFD